MTTVLVFGASGFLGKHVRAALEQDARVERVLTPGRTRLDLLAASADDVAGLLRETGADVVVNCTGRLDGSWSELLMANTLVTAKIVEAIGGGRAQTRLVRIVSAGEYGPVPRGRAVHEDDVVAPVSGYGLSHSAATRLLALAAAAGQVDGVTLRVCNPIGPGLTDETLLGRAAGRLRAAVSSGAGSVVMGPLGAYRDFVDARDVASAVLAAVIAPTLPVPVLNVGSGQAVTAREAVQLLAQAAGFAGALHEQGAATGRSAAVDWMLADISQAAQVLGWRPGYELAESVKAIWADTAGTRSQAVRS